MLATPFHGSRDLIDMVDAAVVNDCPQSVTSALRDNLCRIIQSRQVQLPACVFDSCGDHYARRELYRSEAYGYSVIAMTWGPGQGTAIHDHDGMWCVEGVWSGALEIVQYELLNEQAERFCFRSTGSVYAGPGSAGSLIPPHEYHTIRNACDNTVAVSLHIYAAPMTRCAVFRPLPEDQWYLREIRQLGLDRVQ